MSSIPLAKSFRMRLAALENECSFPSLEHIVIQPYGDDEELDEKLDPSEFSLGNRPRFRRHSRSLSSIPGDSDSDLNLDDLDIHDEDESDMDEGFSPSQLRIAPSAFALPSFGFPQLKVEISESSDDSSDSEILLMEGDVTPRLNSEAVLRRRRSSLMKLHSDLVKDGIGESFRMMKDGIQVGEYEIKIDGIASFPSTISSDSGISPISEGSDSTPTSRIQSSDFEIFGSRIGKGNSGTVVKAINMKDFRVYAIKNIGVHLKANRHQMVKELNTYHSIQCPTLVSFYGAFFDQGNTSFVLEYMNRGSLQDVIDKVGAVKDETILKRIAKQITMGLYHLHSNQQVHRDIKPANILLNRSGQAKITDFGISRQLAPLQEAQSFVGTRIYMSPERIQSQKYGYPSDIWSFGLTLQTLATGKFPYTPQCSASFLQLFQTITKEAVPRLSRSRFSAEFRSFISHCLQKNPSERWSAQQLLQHPFIKDVDESTPMRWPWDTDSSHDIKDLKAIIHVLSKRVYDKKQYKCTEESLWMIANIAESLSIPEAEVRTIIEQNLPIKCFAESPFH